MLSIPHLVVIFVIVLVIFGPDKLPELARNLGKLMAEFDRTKNDLRGTFETHLRDLEREANEHHIEHPKRPAASLPAPADPPAIVAAPGIVPANAPHAAALEGDSAASSLHLPDVPPDNPMMFPDDPDDLIRQAEAQMGSEEPPAESALEPASERTSESTSDVSTHPA